MKEYSPRQIAAMTGRPTHTANRIVKAYRDEKRICDMTTALELRQNKRTKFTWLRLTPTN
ncbi:hypothetical protein HPB50_029509 [Hyalomma asiaticum]|nr:hypothetical protein HPB50_029509 [Hyalomma asiaticum]